VAEVTLFEAEPAAVPQPVFRVRMTVAYDGTGYRGFAAQPQQKSVKTVAGDLAGAIGKVLGHPVELTCAGRTDAGVHAWGQVVSFDAHGAPDEVDLEGLRRSLNRMLGPAVVVREAAAAPEGFDARRWATARAYRYTVLNRAEPDPFLARTAWHVEETLDLRAMQLACDPVIGEHDFSAFCRRPQEDASLVRRVHDARWLDLGEGLLRFDVEANAFCHQMVRSLVGLMVAVGSGRKRAGDVAWILRSGDRHKAGQPAPPQGLCLWEVRYRDESSRPVPEVPTTP
jgi:tRNA pseudouridine38-40 synthase